MPLASTTKSPEQPRLKITEIFYSLQGEARTVGYPTVFIRLTGCPLRCGYCDTAYAFSGGEWMTLGSILEQLVSYPACHVTVTGGEPLAQQACLELLSLLCDKGYDVSIETSGSMDISGIDARVSRVMDLKTPGSGEQVKNRYENLQCLTQHDQIKFVICDRLDFDWACEQIRQHQLAGKCELLMSPVHGDLKAVDLAEWILESGLNVRFQMQLHKLLWGDEAGR
ncbi:MAG: 7-carboxy-7-deazaguanine synthase QueE [Gammaproteobacteria bacterium]|nr:7-carboxy-7-deazaguanine synthase QueE [Gammaproteobacteria bacterium]